MDGQRDPELVPVLERRARDRLLADRERRPVSSWFVCVTADCPEPAVVRAETLSVQAGGAGSVVGAGVAPVCMRCGGQCWEVQAGWLEDTVYAKEHGELMSKLGEVCEVLARGETLRIEPQEIPGRAVELARETAWQVEELLNADEGEATTAVLVARIEQAAELLDVALKLGRRIGEHVKLRSPDAIADAMTVMDARDVLRGERPLGIDLAARAVEVIDDGSGEPPEDGTLTAAAWKVGCVLREDPSAGDRPLMVLADAVRDVVLEVARLKREAIRAGADG